MIDRHEESRIRQKCLKLIKIGIGKNKNKSDVNNLLECWRGAIMEKKYHTIIPRFQYSITPFLAY
ncbi:MAG: hypothetical protein AMJ60_09795 [Desulfobacterales bacterium SG8_35]|nr:MAG: hypothetical protein AMJ60_09795 [Desulfobacterales bacterium SG8_35]